MAVPPSQLSAVQLTVADNTTTKYNVTLPSLEGEEQRRESVAFLLRLEEIDRNLTAEFALVRPLLPNWPKCSSHDSFSTFSYLLDKVKVLTISTALCLHEDVHIVYSC